MITMRSLPPGAMGPAPHRSPHRHDAPRERPRRIRRAIGALGRRLRPEAVAPALSPAEA